MTASSGPSTGPPIRTTSSTEAAEQPVAADTRDYEQWHAHYDDPGSDLSWRLHVVRDHIAAFLDDRPGSVRVMSVCAGDGRDVIEVLARRSDAHRVHTTLLEIHPTIAARAQDSADAAGLDVDVRQVDAGSSDAYVGIEPADLVLLVGIFGNVSDPDIFRTIASVGQLCRPGAALIWSRARDVENFGDRNPDIRSAFRAAGFSEIAYLALEAGNLPAIGVERYDGPITPLVPRPPGGSPSSAEGGPGRDRRPHTATASSSSRRGTALED